MRETRVSLPELGLIGVTRAALGIGIGLLLSERMSERARRSAGWALIVSGALITIPLAVEVLTKGRSTEVTGTNAGVRTDMKERSRPGTSPTSMSAPSQS
jgi:hypothetical protein